MCSPFVDTSIMGADGRQLFSKMRSVLASALKPNASITNCVSELLLLLNQLEEAAYPDKGPGGAPRPEYTIEMVGDREMLTERRGGRSPHPLRCPEDVFVATAMAVFTDDGRAFAEIKDIVKRGHPMVEAR